MSLCILCKADKPSCYSSCDKCKVGLCDNCCKTYDRRLEEIFKRKILNCPICKTNFEEFCDCCQNQTINNMLQDKITTIQNTNDKIPLLNVFNNPEKTWESLSAEVKQVLRMEPNEYLLNHFHYCDCDNNNHCYYLAQKQCKQEFNIPNFYLFEHGIYHLFCGKCWYNYYKFEPTDYERIY